MGNFRRDLGSMHGAQRSRRGRFYGAISRRLTRPTDRASGSWTDRPKRAKTRAVLGPGVRGCLVAHVLTAPCLCSTATTELVLHHQENKPNDHNKFQTDT